MYDMKLNFKSTVFMPIDEKIAEMCSRLPGCPVPGHNFSVQHTMTITGAEKIPDKKFLSASCELLKNNLQKALENKKGQVLETVFEGFSEIEEKEAPDLTKIKE